VTALISVKPGLYSGDADRLTKVSRADQVVRSQVALLESKHVVRSAISSVGWNDVKPSDPLEDDYADLSPLSINSVSHVSEAVTRDDSAYINAKAALNIRYDPSTELVRLAFRHHSPPYALALTNALVGHYHQRYFELYNNKDLIPFFWEQRQQSSEAFTRSSQALSEFPSTNLIYQIDEQQRLLLEQKNRLALVPFKTNGMIAEKAGQASAIPAKLSQMKPLGHELNAEKIMGAPITTLFALASTKG
jgi:hypothetical protein